MNNIQSMLYCTNLDRLIAFVRISRRELNGHGFSVQSIFQTQQVNYYLESKFGIGSKFISFEKMFK